MRYWLLETTRAYAREKLTENGELEHTAGRHANFYLNLCGQAETEWETCPAGEWLAAYGREIGNVRTALDWAYSPGGDESIGVALTAASVPLWFQLSLIDECRRRVEQALSRLEPAPYSGTRREMELYAALGASLLYTKGPVRETGAAWAIALEIASYRNDTEYQLRAFRGLWACHITSGEYRIALAFARRFRDLSANEADPADLLIGERMIGTALHFLGDQTNARSHIERMLADYVAPARRSHVIRFQYDQRVAGCADLALILWLQGFPDQAMRAAQATVDDARAIDHPLSLCYALAQAACPVALSIGDLAAAEHWMTMLLDYSARHALTVWHARGRCFNGALLIKRGDAYTGLRLLSTGVDELRETGFASRFTAFLAVLAEGLADAGQLAEGLATIDEALARSEQNEDRWCSAWLLRVKGELVLFDNPPDAVAVAEDYFRQALDWARRQGALSWELRATTSLARLWRDQGRTADARDLLAPVYDRFTEGFGSLDLKIAKSFLDQFDDYRT
jgi:predicted ATPase